MSWMHVVGTGGVVEAVVLEILQVTQGVREVLEILQVTQGVSV